MVCGLGGLAYHVFGRNRNNALVSACDRGMIQTGTRWCVESVGQRIDSRVKHETKIVCDAVRDHGLSSSR